MVGTESEVRVWLTETREDLSLTQSEVDRRTRKFGPKHRVSQSYLSQIESGTRPFTDLGPERMDALRRVYGIAAEEWVQRTGVSLMTPDAVPMQMPSPDSRQALDYDMPPELVKAIELYSDKFPALKSATVQRNLSLARYYDGSGPQTAEDWLAYYLSIARWIQS